MLKKLMLPFFATALAFLVLGTQPVHACQNFAIDPGENGGSLTFRMEDCYVGGGEENTLYLVDLRKVDKDNPDYFEWERNNILLDKGECKNLLCVYKHYETTYNIFEAGQYQVVFKILKLPNDEEVLFTTDVFTLNPVWDDTPSDDSKITTTGPEAEIVLCDGFSAVKTALGCIKFLDTTSLASSIGSFGIGVGGAAALVILTYSSFQIMTSAGDPRKLAHAKDWFAAGLIGLIMIVLSGFILRLLGVTILGLF